MLRRNPQGRLRAVTRLISAKPIALTNVLLALLLLAFTLTPAQAAKPSAVTLVSFTATVQGSVIDVRWETATEIDVVQFILYRGTTPGTPQQPGSQIYTIPAQTGGVTGAVYNWADDGPNDANKDLQAGVTYYYYLVDIEANGPNPPIGADNNPVTFGPTPTPTLTATSTVTPLPGSTNTPTPTATPTSQFTTTPTPTPSVTPTQIPIRVTDTPQPTPSFTATRVPTDTPIPGATNTPIPPATATPFTTATPTSTTAAGTPLPSDTPAVSESPTAPIPVDTPTPTDTPSPEPTFTPLPAPESATPTRLPPRVQPRETPTPEESGVTRNTAATGLLLCLGGGAIVGAGLLAVVGFVLWRRQPGADNIDQDDQR